MIGHDSHGVEIDWCMITRLDQTNSCKNCIQVIAQVPFFLSIFSSRKIRKQVYQLYNLGLTFAMSKRRKNIVRMCMIIINPHLWWVSNDIMSYAARCAGFFVITFLTKVGREDTIWSSLRTIIKHILGVNVDLLRFAFSLLVVGASAETRYCKWELTDVNVWIWNV